MKKPAKGKPEPPSEEVEQVTLSPVFGMRPGVYLSVLYGFVLILLLFLLLFLPGIVRFGSRVTFDTAPAGASVLVDGIRVGATPATVFVPAGTHSVEMRKAYFAAKTETVAVGGRAFFSLFAPRRLTVSAALKLSDSHGLLDSATEDFASWALYGEANGQYQFPPVLHDAVRDFYAGGAGSTPGAAAQWLNGSVRDVQSPVLLRDYVSAQALDASAGRVLGPLQAGMLVKNFIQLAERSQDFSAWLIDVLGQDAAAAVTKSAWYAAAQSHYNKAVTSAQPLSIGAGVGTSGPPFAAGRVSIDGLSFVRVPGGTFVMGNDEQNRTPTDALLVPHLAVQTTEYMMTTEVTRAEYARFLSANPMWAPSQKSELAAKGLVDEHYLDGWDSSSPSDRSLPVTNVSFAAAGAFAAWIETSLPGELSAVGATVHVPSEREWEYAAIFDAPNPSRSVFLDTYPNQDRKPQPVGTGDGGRVGIFDLLGNVWEWTSDWYHPAAPALAPWPGSAQMPMPSIGAQRVVKGGSWANRYDGVSIASRGSSPPDWCTPYLGFRLVISVPGGR